MTQPVSVNKTVNLGIVTINNKRYMAILHFDNVPKDYPVEGIQKTHEVATRLFQNVVDRYSKKGTVTQVSEQGFLRREKGVFLTHEKAKSQKAWEEFVGCLGRELQMEDIDRIILQEIDPKSLAEQLYHKIKAAQDQTKEFPRLTEEEKTFLSVGTTLPFNQFLTGEFDDSELNDLLIISVSLS